jgi:hypothetical protein
MFRIEKQLLQKAKKNILKIFFLQITKQILGKCLSPITIQQKQGTTNHTAPLGFLPILKYWMYIIKKDLVAYRELGT